MDEEKKKRLEELRKELDPEILSKMAKYLGGDEAAAVASVGAAGNNTNSTPEITGSSTKNLADISRERRAMKFQERMARRKREASESGVPAGKTGNTPEIGRPIYIFSTLDIWTKIIDSQFRLLGYSESFHFSSFSNLIKEILRKHKENSETIFDIAVAFQDIKLFIYSWQELRQNSLSEDAEKFLDSIHLFFVVETMRQVTDKFISVYGVDSIISITDDLNDNKVKIANMNGAAEKPDNKNASEGVK